MSTFISIENKAGQQVSSGTGNATIYFKSLTANTGRSPRETNIRVFASTIKKEIIKTIKQDSTPEFVKWKAATYTTDNEGGTVTLYGTSNARGLTFINPEDVPKYLESSDFNFFKVNGISDGIFNGDAIPGDKGAYSEYDFSLTLRVNANTTIDPVQLQIICRSIDNSNLYSTTKLVISAGEAYLLVDGREESTGDEHLDVINIGSAAGLSTTMSIESNIEWIIEEID